MFDTLTWDFLTEEETEDACRSACAAMASLKQHMPLGPDPKLSELVAHEVNKLLTRTLQDQAIELLFPIEGASDLVLTRDVIDVKFQQWLGKDTYEALRPQLVSAFGKTATVVRGQAYHRRIAATKTSKRRSNGKASATYQ